MRIDRLRLISDHLTSAVLVAVAALAGVLLLLPTIVVVLASFTSTAYLSFPPAGFSLRWYERLLASAAVEEAGLEPFEVTSGGEALLAFVSGAPALVLLYLDMPGDDGPRTCEALRARRESRHTPILGMSRRGDA